MTDAYFNHDNPSLNIKKLDSLIKKKRSKPKAKKINENNMYLSLTLQDTEQCNDLTDIVKRLYKLGVRYFDFQLWYDFNIIVCKVENSFSARGLFGINQIINIDHWDDAPNGRFYDMGRNSLMLTTSAIGLFSHVETILPLLRKSNLTQSEKDLIVNYGFFILSKEGELGFWSDLGNTRNYLVKSLQYAGVTVRDSEILQKPVVVPLKADQIR